MRFTKMHGCGNDFVVVDSRDGRYAGLAWGELAPRLLDRHTGVGGDQLLVMWSSHATELGMRVFNADGSEAEMCGNGLRAVALYAGVQREGQDFEVVTLAGSRRVRVVDANKGIVRVRMGKAQMGERKRSGSLEWQLVSMGNPHVVAFLDSPLSSFPLHEKGPELEPEFRSNVEVVRMKDRSHCEARVWERGAGLTLACGSGACAVFAACRAQGLVDGELHIRFPGGTLLLSCGEGEEGEEIFMTGPAVKVFEGEWPL